MLVPKLELELALELEPLSLASALELVSVLAAVLELVTVLTVLAASGKPEGPSQGSLPS